MARRERRKFSDEYKAEVVAVVRSAEKNIGEISRDLDRTETAAREWVQRADVDGGKRNGLTTAERDELSRLRRQVRVLEEERSILKKAAASSRGRRNAHREFSCRSHEAERLPRPGVEPVCNGVEIVLAVHREIGLARQVLPEQTVGVLV
jgi:transposase